MNARILVELEGVEAGSGDCDACRHRDYFCQTMTTVCTLFFEDIGGGMKSCKVLEGDGPQSCLRCPACLAAEEKAKEK